MGYMLLWFWNLKGLRLFTIVSCFIVLHHLLAEQGTLDTLLGTFLMASWFLWLTWYLLVYGIFQANAYFIALCIVHFPFCGNCRQLLQVFPHFCAYQVFWLYKVSSIWIRIWLMCSTIAKKLPKYNIYNIIYIHIYTWVWQLFSLFWFWKWAGKGVGWRAIVAFSVV